MIVQELSSLARGLRSSSALVIYGDMILNLNICKNKKGFSYDDC